MSRFTDWLLDLFYPTKCILCRKRIAPGRPSICPRCQEIMPSAAGNRRKGKDFTVCVSALYYENDVKYAIRRYKFHGAQAYASAFGELIAQRVYEDLDQEYDVITWVPLAPDRLRERGYDQSRLLAENAAGRLRKPVVSLLAKRRGVGAQSLAVSSAQRRSNIAGAFFVKEPGAVAGKRILIIDDIVTTDATLSECAKVLRAAGAKEVVCATLAMIR